MRKLIKFLFSFILFLVLLVVVGIGAILYLVDPNDYKEEITALVEKKTGRQLRLEGDIQLSFFPWLGLDLGRIGLSNAEGFGNQEMVSAQAASVRLKVFPLFKKRVELDTLQLEGVELHLARNALGHFNWDDMVARATESASKVDTSKQKATSDTANAPFTALQFGGLAITQAHISWSDAQTGQHVELRDLTLKSGPFTAGQTMDFASTSQFAEQSSGLTGHFSFQGQLVTDVELHSIEIRGLALEVDAKGTAIPGDGIKTRLAMNLQAQPKTQRIQFSAVNLGLEGSAIPGGAVQLSMETAVDLMAQTLTLKGLQIKALGLHGKGHMEGKNILSSPEISWALAWEKFNPKEVLQLLGQTLPKSADATVLQWATLAMEGQASPTQFHIKKLQLRLDDSHLSGQCKVENFNQPEIYYRLTMDGIDLDRYLPPVKEGARPPPAAAAEAGIAQASQQLPLDTLRALRINGDLQVGSLKVKRLLAKQVGLAVRAQGGRIELKPSIKHFYGGSYQGKVVLDVRGNQPKIDSKKDLVGVQIGSLLRDLKGEERLSGRAELHLQLHSEGLEERQLRKNLQGKVTFRFDKGAVHGFNLAERLRTTKAHLTGQPLPKSSGPNKTDFSEISGSFKINRGVAHNRDFLAKSPFFRVTGKGKIDLAKERLDYQVKTLVVSTPEGQGGKELEELIGIPIPIRLKGALQNPAVSIDIKEAITSAQKKKLKDKAKKKLMKKLKLDRGKEGAASPEQELIRRGLDSLFR